MIASGVRQVGTAVNAQLERFGVFLYWLAAIGRQGVTPPFRYRLILQHLEFVGYQSLGIITLTGFFTGAVFGLQIAGVFAVFSAEGLTGGATAIALATELAPLVTGFLLTGRVGSAMTAEISTMKVGEQIDAMEAMGVDPLHYLVVPRVIASAIMMPLLCGVFMVVGVAGSYVTGVLLFDVDQGVFFEKMVRLVKLDDVALGLRKMFAFALIISIMACRYGLRAGGGAKGVGVATTNAVVHTLVMLLTTDFVISYIQVRWFR